LQDQHVGEQTSTYPDREPIWRRNSGTSDPERQMPNRPV
jgi:hypothetical protein